MLKIILICPNCQKSFQREARKVRVENPCCSKSCSTKYMYATGKRYSPPLEQRFWGKVDIGNPDECWNWTGFTNHDGYGGITILHKSVGAHRVAYSLKYGEIPTGLHVCHKCDNRLCCNYNHLFLGTNADNQADKNAKGRQAKGEISGPSKLIVSQVNEIRNLYATGRFTKAELAGSFQISVATVGQIVKGKTWRHLLTA